MCRAYTTNVCVPKTAAEYCKMHFKWDVGDLFFYFQGQANWLELLEYEGVSLHLYQTTKQLLCSKSQL